MPLIMLRRVLKAISEYYIIYSIIYVKYEGARTLKYYLIGSMCIVHICRI